MSAMDKETLKALTEEATKEARRSRREFEKHDNSEDMHAWERWTATVAWLREVAKRKRTP